MQRRPLRNKGEFVISPHEREAERKLIVALDISDAARAIDVWQSLGLTDAVCKIGLELLFSGGIALVDRFRALSVPVFVDAKLYDIGNTVERAAGRVADLGATFLTVHSQDRKTVEAAVRGRGNSPLRLLGITLLTNVEPTQLPEQGVSLPVDALIERRASFALEAGFDGVVSSPREIRMLKAQCGDDFLVVCPGVRPRGTAQPGNDDQVRTATPGEALLAGADFIVVGRPILSAPDPRAAVQNILCEMADALRGRNAGPADRGRALDTASSL